MIGGACRDIEEIKGVSGLGWLGLEDSRKLSQHSMFNLFREEI